MSETLEAMRAGLLGLLLFAAAAAAASPALAQRVVPDDRPADDRPELPAPSSTEDDSGPILPPITIPGEQDLDGLAGGLEVRVDAIRVRGNTLLPEEVVRRIVADYEGRRLDYARLAELRDRLTLAYVDRGYVTSGAVLPTQSLADGVVEIEVVEGRLSGVEVVNPGGRFRDRYFEARLLRPGQPVDVGVIERALRILQQDPRIERVEARLEPGSERGRAQLRVRVRESRPWSLAAETSNHRNPSIGPYGATLRMGYDNVLGVGDRLGLRTTFTEGLRQAAAVFSIPLNRFDTELSLRVRWSDAEVVSEPVSSIVDIDSRSTTYGLELRQPLLRTTRLRTSTFLRAELRRSRSQLDGSGFSFSTDPDEEGESRVSVLRWGIDATWRTRRQAVALRSLLSVGLDALDATNSPRPFPDGRFVAWLAQGQYALRLPWADMELVTRGDLQLAQDPLLPFEQFAIGGRYSVRGYRENTIVRDNGVLGSIELRLPIHGRIEPRSRLELVPFFDVGHAWNTERQSVGRQTLLSVGLGGRAALGPGIDAELWWGRRLARVERVGDRDLQDDGIHFRISISFR